MIVFSAAVVAGCVRHSTSSGSLDRTYAVSGPVRLELTNGNGESKVVAGPPGEVRIHADFRSRTWGAASAQRRLSELRSNPPISQEGNLIQIGGSFPSSSTLTIDYTIIVPPDSQIHGTTGSGEITTTGVEGPASFKTGSGNISATSIKGDIQARTGSGSIQLASIQGQVEAAAGSGEVSLADVRGDIRVQTGSGGIRIAQPAGAIVASSSSGNIDAAGVNGDLRVRTVSGNVVVTGDPRITTYWDFRTTSGNVILQVPAAANLRFYAKTTSGDINAGIPIEMEGTTSGPHELHARIGDGKARVAVETSSGNISLR